MAARRRRRIDSYSNTTPRETNTYSRALYCKRVANNKMYLDNYHLLANTTLARNGTEEAQERQFIYTETRSSRGGGVGSTGVGEMGAQEWTETTRVEVSQRALCVRVEYTELSLACSAPYYDFVPVSNNKTAACHSPLLLNAFPLDSHFSWLLDLVLHLAS